MKNDSPGPRKYLGVMISSTFSDLKDHRAALINAIKSQGLTDIGMENDSARADLDVIDASLQMVRDGSAYIGVISRKYGQTPKSAARNPNGLSLTELEFNEALRLGRPILLFIMGENHPLLREADVEIEPENRKKLQAFRERAKKMGPDSEVQRVFTLFDSPEEFAFEAAQGRCEPGPLSEQRSQGQPQQLEEPTKDDSDVIPLAANVLPGTALHWFTQISRTQG